MSNRNNMIPIPGRLHSVAVGEPVSGADEIYDDTIGKTQAEINQTIEPLPDSLAYLGDDDGQAVIPGFDPQTDTLHKAAQVLTTAEKDQVAQNLNNRPSTNGMARIELKATDNFKSVVEAQTGGNTIFVIKYDFTLTGNVTVPANCVLAFDGGSIRGGDIQLSNNTIVRNGEFREFGKLTIGSNTQIINCTFDGLTSDGAVIYGNNISDLKVEGSKIVVNSSNLNNEVSGIKILNGTNINIYNCIFTGSKNASESTYSLSCPLLVEDSANVRVVKCLLTSSATEGLAVNNSSQVLFEGNVAYGSGWSGICCDKCDYVVVNANHVYNTGASCITTNCNYQVITNNNLHNNLTGGGIATGHGLGPDYYTRKCIVSGNILTDIKGVGISAAQPEELIISNNTIKNVSLVQGSSQSNDGIYMAPELGTVAVKRINISSNVIDNTRRGISLPVYKSAAGNTTISINNNIVSNSSNSGIEAYGNNISIHNNEIQNSTNYSIKCWAPILNIQNNIINKGISIEWNNTVATISYNKGTGEGSFITLNSTDLDNLTSSGVDITITDNYYYRLDAGELIQFNNNYFNTTKSNIITIKDNNINTISGSYDANVLVPVPTSAYNSSNFRLKFILNTINGSLFIYHPISSDSYKPRMSNNEKGYRVYVIDTDKVLRWDGNNTWTEVDA